MADPKEIAIARKTKPQAAQDPSQLCQCDFDELLGTHVAGLCDSLRKSPVFSR